MKQSSCDTDTLRKRKPAVPRPIMSPDIYIIIEKLAVGTYGFIKLSVITEG